MSFLLGREGLIIAGVIVYMVLTSLLAWVLRSKTSAQFMVAGRALPAGVIGVFLMSEFIGANSSVGGSQAAFEKGMAAGWAVVAAAIGFLLLAIGFARTIRESSQVTISGLIEQRFGSTARAVVSVMMIFALLLVNAGNYLSGAAALSPALHLSLTGCAVVIAAASSIYYVFGGLKSTAYVTVLHSLVKVVGIGVIVAVAIALSGGIEPMQRALPVYYFTWDGAVGGSTIIAWIVGTTGAIFSSQFIVQAIAAAQTPKSAQRAAFLASALCLPLGVAIGFIGVAARYLYPTQKSLFALPVFIAHMDTPLATLVTVSLVASVLVSVSTVALGITALIMRDFYVPWRKPTPEQELSVTRLVGVAVGAAPLVVVLLAPHIQTLSFFTRALRLSITIVALMGVYLPWVRSGRAAVVALVGSGLATTAWYLFGNPFGVDNMYVAAALPALVLLGERLLPRRKPAPNSTTRETHA
ncbi:sodium:solute symporter family protein [Phenylobacterium sp.]|uniref:sodium:solute symporter family protein n=1 Tax=Phenylobacterium sp. TaxID=1871053 RepID=UPI002CFC0B1F|nr:sodium:solute symporter family protein [Phenylobacterium sp.]HLZ75187.1 sodium:solute symporter family protein [Phenylobacterium sp.]